MTDVLTQLWREIVERPDGPMAFRFYLQPVMAMLFALRDGIKDAHTGRPAYFWALFTDRPHRRQLVRSGWSSVRNVFILAVVMDLIYQFIVFKELRPLEGLLVAVLLAIVPYVLIRGPVNRITRGLLHRRATH
ncbi:hypothetical protein BO221_18380 [Archangium sp. Cb G35]|uniref:hypothetical protein n=1 Tax=Archangium sp. Cb G35 TaxID=1920190 RepID=UPI0009363E4E|nr:hypothetical protein [Archangium sp. Cb G35]OJT23922.1 hypothetical protein BO221_18380 [Archangium sp. Cb G35]